MGKGPSSAEEQFAIKKKPLHINNKLEQWGSTHLTVMNALLGQCPIISEYPWCVYMQDIDLHVWGFTPYSTVDFNVYSSRIMGRNVDMFHKSATRPWCQITRRLKNSNLAKWWEKKSLNDEPAAIWEVDCLTWMFVSVPVKDCSSGSGDSPTIWDCQPCLANLGGSLRRKVTLLICYSAIRLETESWTTWPTGLLQLFPAEQQLDIKQS